MREHVRLEGVADQALNVQPYVLRPLADEFVKAFAVAGVKGARCFLVTDGFPAIAERNRPAASIAKRTCCSPGSRFLASSSNLRSAAQASLGCGSSHSQWRGSGDTSRAITPSFGRPWPARTRTGSARVRTSDNVPRRSKSTFQPGVQTGVRRTASPLPS